MTNLFELFRGKERKRNTGIEAMVGQTIEALSYAYKVEEDSVRNIIIDWMRFERDVRAGIYD